MGPSIVTVAAAIAAIGAWLPFLGAPLMPDEAGFLIIAEQWDDGRSLYGDYWVDRPPLIIWIYTLVSPFVTIGHTADGATALAIKLLGAGVAAVSVLLAGFLARRVAPDSRWTHLAAPVLTLVLVSSPLLGMPSTNGELLAVPFVLAGLALLIPGLVQPDRRHAAGQAAAAGACACAAVMVKQNFIDVYVFALVGFAVMWVRREGPLRVCIGFVAGSVAVLMAVVALAVIRGSSIAGLWEAVVTFRFHATSLIGLEIGDSRIERIGILVAAFVFSGAAALLALTVVMVQTTHGRRHPRIGRLAMPATAMATWEVAGVALGGSYWLHYLTGVVPSVVLLVILAGSLERRRVLLTAGVALAGVTNACIWAYRIADPPPAREDARVAAYLRQQSLPDDGLLVGFGHPNVYVDAELRGTYPYMWSLTTRVKDPELQRAKQVLSGPDAPRWFVVHEDTPVYWEKAARSARRYVEANYIRHRAVGEWQVWERAPTAGRP